MKNTIIFAALNALVLFVFAVPLEKRDIIWVTDYVQVTETVAVIQTVWVDATDAPLATSTSWSSSTVLSPTLPLTTTLSEPTSSDAASTSPLPTETSLSTSYTTSIAPAALTTTPVVESTASIVTSAVALTTSTPPPTLTTSPVVDTSTTTTAAATSATGTSYSGDMTFYDVGLGSCGWISQPTDFIVALSTLYMNNPANPNNNPLCGKTITISYGGKETQAKVVDTCEGCSYSSIDMSDSLFAYFSAFSVGRVHDVEWWFD